MLKTHFNPPRNLFGNIKCSLYYPHIFLIPPVASEDTIKHLSATIGIFRGLFSEYYGNIFTKDSQHSQYLVGNILWERMKDSFRYGNGGDPTKHTMIAIWLGEAGVLCGFRDEGNFFEKKETKHLLENRIAIPERLFGDKGYRHGIYLLYERAADIVMNTEEKTLYVTYMMV